MTRLRAIAPLLVAAALAAAAFATVQAAGCADPGRYEMVDGGYVLVGGCIAPGDIVLPEPAPPAAVLGEPDAPVES